jgi:hypothetical protein
LSAGELEGALDVRDAVIALVGGECGGEDVGVDVEVGGAVESERDGGLSFEFPGGGEVGHDGACVAGDGGEEEGVDGELGAGDADIALESAGVGIAEEFGVDACGSACGSIDFDVVDADVVGGDGEGSAS